MAGFGTCVHVRKGSHNCGLRNSMKCNFCICGSIFFHSKFEMDIVQYSELHLGINRPIPQN